MRVTSGKKHWDREGTDRLERHSEREGANETGGRPVWRGSTSKQEGILRKIMPQKTQKIHNR